MDRFAHFCGAAALCGLALYAACARRETLPEAPPEPLTSTPAASAGAPAASPAAPPASASTTATAGPQLSDFSCTLALDGAPGTLKAGGETVTIAVTVTNRSKAGETWLAMRPERSVLHVVNLGSRWFSPAGATEGARAPLTADLAPGQSATVRVTVKSPPAPGDYELRIEPVQEAVAWFHDLHGCGASVAVKVTN